MMPSRYSSEHSVSDAEDLAKRQGLHALTIPIASMVDAFTEELSPAGFPAAGLPAENLQARVRGVVLMALSNAGGHLVLTTGNKSEIATGYSTLYGDSAGGFAPIKDVLKTMVWELARWRNAEAARRGAVPPIPENSITKPPSAELAPGQLDTDSLPPYDVLDALLDDYVERDMGVSELIAAGHDPALVAAGGPARRRRRVQAAAVPAGPEDQPEELRPGPAPPDHQPVARGAALSPEKRPVWAGGLRRAGRSAAHRMGARLLPVRSTCACSRMADSTASGSSGVMNGRTQRPRSSISACLLPGRPGSRLAQ